MMTRLIRTASVDQLNLRKGAQQQTIPEQEKQRAGFMTSRDKSSQAMRGEDESHVSGCHDMKTELRKGEQQVAASPGAGGRVEVAVELADKLKPLLDSEGHSVFVHVRGLSACSSLLPRAISAKTVKESPSPKRSPNPLSCGLSCSWGKAFSVILNHPFLFFLLSYLPLSSSESFFS